MMTGLLHAELRTILSNTLVSLAKNRVEWLLEHVGLTHVLDNAVHLVDFLAG